MGNKEYSTITFIISYHNQLSHLNMLASSNNIQNGLGSYIKITLIFDFLKENCFL